MRFLILALCGMFLGSAGAFLLYVSVLSILTVLVILTAAMLMFQLGVLVERHRQVPEIPPETAMPKLQEPHAPLNVRLQA